MPPPLRTSAPSRQSLDKPGPGARTTYQKGSGPAHFSLFTSCRRTFLPGAPLDPFHPTQGGGGREGEEREGEGEREDGREGRREEVWGRAPTCALDPQSFRGQPSSAGAPEVLTPGPPPGRVSPAPGPSVAKSVGRPAGSSGRGGCLRGKAEAAEVLEIPGKAAVPGCPGLGPSRPRGGVRLRNWGPPDSEGRF